MNSLMTSCSPSVTTPRICILHDVPIRDLAHEARFLKEFRLRHRAGLQCLDGHVHLPVQLAEHLLPEVALSQQLNKFDGVLGSSSCVNVRGGRNVRQTGAVSFTPRALLSGEWKHSMSFYRYTRRQMHSTRGVSFKHSK